jgi:tetratricopeptide (TPR) repeat protein
MNRAITKFLILLMPTLVFYSVSAQVPNYKIEHASKIVANIANQFGKEPPILEIVPISSNKNVIAQFTTVPKPTIKIDEKLLDICASFNKDSTNALAILIAHELAHYFLEHNWCGDYAFAIRDNASLSKQLIKISKADKCAIEAQADSKGLYYASIAGYNPFAIYNQLIDRVYKSYKLPSTTKGYPSLPERKQIAANELKTTTDLLPNFYKGNACLQNRKYDSAAYYFKTLIEKFASRENYNNLGVAFTLQALDLKNIEINEQAYPIEIDFESRMNLERMRGNNDNTEAMIELLKNAKASFEKAMAKDKTYYKAYINLACVYDLMDNKYGALGVLKEVPNSKLNEEVIWSDYVKKLNEQIKSK